jgi:two-component system, OmpR family, alkaline phosphatase synthesis response regulator PhoP
VQRVVVADDDPDIVDILKFNLEAAGYDVLTAEDGEAARDLILASVPDLVVLDIMMPKMDGLEVLTVIKAHTQTRSIPVVMLTAKTSDNDLWQGWDAGADYYITKPFDLEELMRFIGYLQVNGQLAQ